MQTSVTDSVSRTKVDLAGLMKVLGEHLYSTPLVALRELVQNAHDSCHRRRIESPNKFTPRIDVTSNPGKRTLSIADTGAGLTRDEIENYLATVGAGYTRTLRDRGDDKLIGYFGLGFLSAFIVSERVEVVTCSHAEPDKTWRFSSRAGHTYTVVETRPRAVGTEVTLHLTPRFAELADLAVVRSILERYCVLLEFPVHCGAGEPVNSLVPPWRDPAWGERSALRQNKLAMELAQRFEPDFAPLCCLPIRAPESTGGQHDDEPFDMDDGDGEPVDAAAQGEKPCRGLLWIQDSATYGTSDNRNVWVFVRGMMVTSEDRELLPGWAGFAGALLESDALVPTASRESLQKNRAYRRARKQIHESLIAGLAELAGREPATWQRILLRHNEALLGAALCDDRLFDLLSRDLTVPTSEGDMTVPTILEASAGKIHVSQSDDSGFEELLFRALKVPVVRGTRYAALPFCRLFSQRGRGALVMVGTGTGDHLLFRQAEVTDAERAMLEAWFACPDSLIVPARFAPAHLPLIAVPDRDVELKRRIEDDKSRRAIAGAALALAQLYTDTITSGPRLRLYINLDCPAITALFAAPEPVRALCLDILRAFASLSSEPAQRGTFMDVDEALGRLSAALAALLKSASANS